MTGRDRSRRAAVFAAAILVAACGAATTPTLRPQADPPADSTAAPTDAPTPSPTPSALGWREACAGAATSPITLTAWDRETGEGTRAVIEQVAAEFEAANPGVTVRAQKGADGPVDAILAALDGPGGPDVVQVGQGRAAMGAAVAAGLLLPLTPYAEQYRWDDRWAPGILARASFADDGTGWGSGTLYGVPLTGDVVGYFFNHRMAAEDRPSRPAPSTLDEELEDYAAIRDAGLVPIVLGAADGDAVALYGTLVESMVEPGWSDAVVYGRDGATFDVPGAVAAAERLVELGDRGFLSSDYASIGHAEALARFAEGGGQLLLAGTDVMPTLDAAADTVGYYGWLFYPPMAQDPDGYARAIGRIGDPWAVRRGSPNADCAAAFLDFLTGNHAAELLAAHGVLASHYEGGAPTEMLEYVGRTFREVSLEDRLGHRLDEAFPGARDVFAANLAKLLAKEITPQQLVANVERAYRAHLATLE